MTAAYRERFRPAVAGGAPRLMLALAGACARSDEEAESESKIAGHRSPLIQPTRSGSVSTCAEQLAQVIEHHRPDELMLLDVSQTLPHKRESYELWREAVALASR